MTYEIEIVQFADVRKFASPAAREHVSVTDLPGTTWYTVRGIACAGLQVKGQRARIRGVYVDPAFRGDGLGTTLGERLIDDAIARGCALVDAYVINERWYLAHGFTEKARNAFGRALMVRALTPP